MADTMMGRGVTGTGSRSGRRLRRRDLAEGKVSWPLTILLVLGSLTVLVPLYFTVVTALKTPAQLGGAGFGVPESWTWSNFADAWRLTNFPQAAGNSLLLTVGALVLTLLTNSLVSYAIARQMANHKVFKGLYFYFVSALFVPFPIIMLPVVKLTAQLGMDNQIGLVLLYTVYGLAFNIFVFVAYIKSIPIELEEAARIDGASTWAVFWRIVFPLLAPMNATVAILTVIWVWNDFMLPLVILSQRDDLTLPLTQYVFQSQFNTNYTVAFASYLMQMAPLLLVYVVAQRWVISGVTRGAIK